MSSEQCFVRILFYLFDELARESKLVIMTNEQIDYVLDEVGGKNAQKYFEMCSAWIKKNWDSLKELHKAFEDDTNSEMDLSVFCSRMYNETKEGRKAAETLLAPYVQMKDEGRSKGGKSRWSGMTKAERSAAMKAVRNRSN